VRTLTTTTALGTYLVRLGDDNLVLGQRLGAYIAMAPELEEDLAIANTGLDHIGIARHLYTLAGTIEPGGRTEDEFAMLRSERQFTNALLVEQPNIDFAYIMVRQFLFDAYQVPLWSALSNSTHDELAGIAAKGHKEATYHLRRSTSWVLRLGDGTEESNVRAQAAVDGLWRFTGELVETDAVEEELAAAHVAVPSSGLASTWSATVDHVLEEATLVRPADPFQMTGGRSGLHTEHLGGLLTELQWMQRSYPGLTW
jgi:ring-1,2-phenylacetyl-CoA epoxidase subunit PaaC